ncbi:MAG: 30S ribosomal protein S5 [Candidatus Aenigmarchaeota archaeon]|nr:30S ribosomal protein S5 [Candidatus Aenigmarchaeota archaeon]
MAEENKTKKEEKAPAKEKPVAKEAVEKKAVSEKKQAPKEEAKQEDKKEERPERRGRRDFKGRRGGRRREEKEEFDYTTWKPKTELGKKVLSGEITDINQVFAQGLKIAEPAIVDILIPGLEKDVIFIGGSTGKGGGIRRTPFKRTSRMHKSGRRYRMSVMAVVGNKNGYVGVGMAASPAGKHREAIQKATDKAKLNIIPIARGCGSWECLCGAKHSIPFTVNGKRGSVKVNLIPAPKGIGLCVSNEIKKIMSFAGISDVWCKSRGNTKMRINFVMAVFSALRKLNVYKIKPEFEKNVGMIVGKVE